MADKPKFNKRTGLYGGYKNPKRPGGGGLGIGSAIRNLVGANKAGDKRRAARASNRAEKKEIRQTRKGLKQELRNQGMKRGAARRLARTTAPEMVASRKADRIAKIKANNQAKRDAKASNPVSSVSAAVNKSQTNKANLISKEKPVSSGAANMSTGNQGKNMGQDMKQMMKEGRFDYKNKNYVGSYAQDIHGTSQKVGQFNKTIDINSKQGREMSRKLYSERFQGNKKAKIAAMKAGKDSFDYTDPHTGRVTKMKTSKIKTTNK